jgi:hypothetical protein
LLVEAKSPNVDVSLSALKAALKAEMRSLARSSPAGRI